MEFVRRISGVLELCSNSKKSFPGIVGDVAKMIHTHHPDFVFAPLNALRKLAYRYAVNKANHTARSE